VFFLEMVLQILEHSGGDADVAIAELDKFSEKYRERLHRIKRKRLHIAGNMTSAERDEFMEVAIERTRSVRERIGAVVRTYPNPPRIFRKLREIILPTSGMTGVNK